MTRRYEVVPNDVTDIRPNDGRGVIDGQEWIRLVGTGLPGEGDRITPIIGRDFSGLDLYFANQDDRNPGPYESWDGTTALSFAGQVLHAPTSRVQETRTFEQIPIDDLRAIKQNELSTHLDYIRHENCQTNLTPNWVIRIELTDREWIASVVNVLEDRLSTIALEMQTYLMLPEPRGGFTPLAPDYWPRDVPIRAINVNTNRYISTVTNADQWGQIMKDIGLHDFSSVDAAQLVQADIDAAVLAVDWDALASIDVKDPLYGWPPVYEPEVNPTGNGT